MIKVYGSSLCDDCKACIKDLQESNLDYEFHDISTELNALKIFIKLRDNLSVFDKAKKEEKIGIPAIVLNDGSVRLDWEELLKEDGLQVYKNN